MLREPVYATLLGGSFIAYTGLWLYIAAAAWVMFDMTASPVLVGIVTAATFIPRVFLAVPAGALVDVLDRRYFVIGGNLFQAAVALGTGVLDATGQLGPWVLIAMTVGIGVGQSLSLPAYHSLLQDIVPRTLIGPAVSLQSGSVNVARAIGPSVGGALIAAGHTDVAFLCTGVSYLALCAAALRLPRRAPGKDAVEPLGFAMRTGLRFMRHSPVLLKLTLSTSLFALASANIQALLAPAAASRDLGAQGYGLLYGCFGVGALLGALATRRLRHMLDRHTQPVAITGFALSSAAFAFVPTAAAAVVSIAVAGAAMVITYSSQHTLVQLAAPAWVRGRVLSLYMISFTVATPIGSVIAGVLADALNTALAITIMSAALLLVALSVYALRLPTITDVDVQSDHEVWERVDHPEDVHGGPVAVLVTWTVDPANVDEFLEAMATVRTSRLRSGAYRWMLCHEPERPGQFTELFEVPDWAEHLRQHDRMDRDAVLALRRLRALANHGRPQVRHLVGLDLTRPFRLPETPAGVGSVKPRGAAREDERSHAR